MDKTFVKSLNRVLLRGSITKLKTRNARNGKHYAWFTITMPWKEYYNIKHKSKESLLNIKVAAFYSDRRKRNFIPFDEMKLGDNIIVKGHLRPGIYGATLLSKRYAHVVATNSSYDNKPE